MHVCVYIYIYVYVYIYIYIHIYDYIINHCDCNRNHKLLQRLLTHFGNCYNYHRFTLLDLCVSFLRRGHGNVLCIVPTITDDSRRDITSYRITSYRRTALRDVIYRGLSSMRHRMSCNATRPHKG